MREPLPISLLSKNNNAIIPVIPHSYGILDFSNIIGLWRGPYKSLLLACIPLSTDPTGTRKPGRS